MTQCLGGKPRHWDAFKHTETINNIVGWALSQTETATKQDPKADWNKYYQYDHCTNLIHQWVMTSKLGATLPPLRQSGKGKPGGKSKRKSRRKGKDKQDQEDKSDREDGAGDQSPEIKLNTPSVKLSGFMEALQNIGERVQRSRKGREEVPHALFRLLVSVLHMRVDAASRYYDLKEEELDWLMGAREWIKEGYGINIYATAFTLLGGRIDGRRYFANGNEVRPAVDIAELASLESKLFPSSNEFLQGAQGLTAVHESHQNFRILIDDPAPGSKIMWKRESQVMAEAVYVSVFYMWAFVGLRSASASYWRGISAVREAIRAKLISSQALEIAEQLKKHFSWNFESLEHPKDLFAFQLNVVDTLNFDVRDMERTLQMMTEFYERPDPLKKVKRLPSSISVRELTVWYLSVLQHHHQGNTRLRRKLQLYYKHGEISMPLLFFLQVIVDVDSTQAVVLPLNILSACAKMSINLENLLVEVQGIPGTRELCRELEKQKDMMEDIRLTATVHRNPWMLTNTIYDLLKARSELGRVMPMLPSIICMWRIVQDPKKYDPDNLTKDPGSVLFFLGYNYLRFFAHRENLFELHARLQAFFQSKDYRGTGGASRRLLDQNGCFSDIPELMMAASKRAANSFRCDDLFLLLGCMDAVAELVAWELSHSLILMESFCMSFMRSVGCALDKLWESGGYGMDISSATRAWKVIEKIHECAVKHSLGTANLEESSLFEASRILVNSFLKWTTSTFLSFPVTPFHEGMCREILFGSLR